jgi:hypothetical protein
LGLLITFVRNAAFSSRPCSIQANRLEGWSQGFGAANWAASVFEISEAGSIVGSGCSGNRKARFRRVNLGGSGI